MSESPESRPVITARECLWVLAGFLAITFLYWRPFLLAPGEHYSVGRDYFQNTWNLWWVKEAWENGLPLYLTDRLFWPIGTSLAFHTITFANTMPGLAIQDFAGLTETHSYLFVAAFPMTAMAAWLLVRTVSGSAWGAFFGGIVYAFAPYHTAMVTQLNNVHFEWVPLFFVALIGLYRNGRWWSVAWAGLFLALAGYVDWYQPIFCAIGGGIYLLHGMASHRRWGDAGLWLRLVAMSVIAVVLVLPGALPLARVMGAEGGNLNVGVRYAGQMNLIGVNPQGSRFFHFWPVVLGWLPCALLVYAVWRVRDRALAVWWWWLGITFLFLQGPYLVVGRHHYESIPMPMALFPHLPLLSVIRVPHRFLILFLLAFAIVAAFGLRELQVRAKKRGKSANWVHGFGLLICLGAALELQPPAPQPVDLQPGVWYASLAADEDDYAVLELPFDFKDAYTMYLQALHGKALIGGYTSHTLPSALAEFERDVMRALLPAGKEYDVDYIPEHLPVDVSSLDAATAERWRNELVDELGVRAIVWRDGPDFGVTEAHFDFEATGTRKWLLALTPFRLNAPMRSVEYWRQKAVAAGNEDLAAKSAQARRLIEALFGPPDRLQGNAAFWDLRGDK